MLTRVFGKNELPPPFDENTGVFTATTKLSRQLHTERNAWNLTLVSRSAGLIWMIFSRLFTFAPSTEPATLNALTCFISLSCNPIQVTEIICPPLNLPLPLKSDQWDVAASTQWLCTRREANGARSPPFKCFHIARSPISHTFYIWPFCLGNSRAIKYQESLMFPGTRTQIKQKKAHSSGGAPLPEY